MFWVSGSLNDLFNYPYLSLNALATLVESDIVRGALG